MRAWLPALVVALTGALLLVGCGGSGVSSKSGPRLVGPNEFAAAVAEPGRVTINVHVPDEGSIAGTDLSIPFDRIEARKSALPGTSTPLAVYCRSGRMSAIAVRPWFASATGTWSSLRAESSPGRPPARSFFLPKAALPACRSPWRGPPLRAFACRPVRRQRRAPEGRRAADRAPRRDAARARGLARAGPRSSSRPCSPP